MTRLRPGKRSEEAKKKRSTHWIETGGYEKAITKMKANTIISSLPKYPDEFCKIRKSAKEVKKRLRQKFPAMIPRDLPSANESGRLLYPVPALPEKKPHHHNHPPYLAMRFESVINNATNIRLVRAWDYLLQKHVHFPKIDPNRSSSPALHLGVWEVYSMHPCISTDSQQTKEINNAMDFFLNLIKQLVAPKITNLLRTHCPIQYARQIQAHARVHQLLAPEFAKRPALDFGGAFFTVAVKEGSSELIHIDFNDNIHGITWVVPLGDWTGGEFCAPQLGVKIPIRPGQVLGVMTKLLAHCGAPITGGRRVILTLFTDHNLLEHGSPSDIVIV